MARLSRLLNKEFAPMYPSRFGLGYASRLTQSARAEQLRKLRPGRKPPLLSTEDAYRIVHRRMGIIGLALTGMVIAMFAVAALVA
jgi:hypothetical protein